MKAYSLKVEVKMPALYHVRFRARIVRRLSCSSKILNLFCLFTLDETGFVTDKQKTKFLTYGMDIEKGREPRRG
jgi:hypothetical protein